MSDNRVRCSPDFMRIRDLPRREWWKASDLDELVAVTSEALCHNRKPCPSPLDLTCKGCRTLGGLLPAQATTLREFYEHRGAMGALCVGYGKTLTSLLAPAVIQTERPLLVVPASVKKQLDAELPQYARHWKVPKIEVTTYSFLSHPNNRTWLEDFDPTLIVLDECQKIKDTSSTVTKRIGGFTKPRPHVPLLCLSGSTSDRSIQQYRHYLTWTLRGSAPVPRDPFEAQVWAYALDEKVNEDLRAEPGALLTLSPAGQDMSKPELERARNAYRDRLVLTPGYVSTMEDIPPVGLVLSVTELELPQPVHQALNDCRELKVLPGGEEFMLDLDLYRHELSLGCGLYYKWDPPAPREWRDARREWFKFVRSKLSHSPSMDSVVHVEERVLSGELQDGGVMQAWYEIEPTFVPNSVPIWIDDTVLKYAAEWLAINKGLCWVRQKAFGRRLSELTGLPFFSQQASTETGMHISEYRAGGAILSYSCREGLNLQDRWCTNLFTCPPDKGPWLEQALGRTHRRGQDEDEVTGEFLLTSRQSYFTMAQCIRDAQMDFEAHGQPRKLRYANVEWGPLRGLIQDMDKDKEIGA